MMVIPPRTRPRTVRPAPVTAGFDLAELAGDEFRRRVRNEAEAGECRVPPMTTSRRSNSAPTRSASVSGFAVEGEHEEARASIYILCWRET